MFLFKVEERTWRGLANIKQTCLWKAVILIRHRHDNDHSLPESLLPSPVTHPYHFVWDFLRIGNPGHTSRLGHCRKGKLSLKGLLMALRIQETRIHGYSDEAAGRPCSV